MKIHSPSPHKQVPSKCNDYFFNYFTLGVVSAYSRKAAVFLQLEPASSVHSMYSALLQCVDLAFQASLSIAKINPQLPLLMQH